LKIPRKKRREYIKTAYRCFGRIHQMPRELSEKLEELSKKKVFPEKAVLELDEMFYEIFLSISKVGSNSYMM